MSHLAHGAHGACADCRELISAFIDGELSPDERARLRAHLAVCEDCRNTLEAYRAIGANVRTLPPVLPPNHLADAIYAQTIDAAPRRLFLMTSRLGYSITAVAAVVLVFIVAGYLLVGGYQRGITPEVAWTRPQQQQQWPIQNPIEIAFNKEMDRDSVIAALAIIPGDEDARLNYAWDGNTLLIGVNQQLKAAQAYSLKITTSARDKWGNPLGEDFELSFTTQPTVATAETPATVVPTPQVAQSTATPERPTSTATPASSEVTGSVNPTEPIPVAPTSTAVVPSTGGNNGSDEPVATYTPVHDPEPTRVATATPTRAPTQPIDEPVIAPTSTPTPSPTPTPVVEEPTATPAPPPPTEPPPTPTSEPEPTPTPDTIAVTGAFADVYWGYGQVQSRLGEPTTWASTVSAWQQTFQYGEMFLREDTSTIYVLLAPEAGGVWNQFQDTATEYPEPEFVSEQGLWIPGGAFGHLWRSDPATASELGYARSQSPSYIGDAQVQHFAHGVMLVTPQIVYVLYDDGTGAWEYYPNSE